MIATTTPTAIWEYTRESINRLERSVKFCRRLESGELLQPYWERLGKDVETGAEDILYALGRASGCTRDPARNSRHATLNQVLSVLRNTIDSSLDWHLEHIDGPVFEVLVLLTPDELMEIARKFGPQLLAISSDELEAEAEAACAMLESEEAGKRGLQPTAAERAVKGQENKTKHTKKGNTAKGRVTIATRATAALADKPELQVLAVTDPREACVKLQKLVGGGDREWQLSRPAGRLVYGLAAQQPHAVAHDTDEPTDAEWDVRDDYSKRGSRFVKKK